MSTSSRSAFRPAASPPANPYNADPPTRRDTADAARAAFRAACLELATAAEHAEVSVLMERYQALRSVLGKVKYVEWRKLGTPYGPAPWPPHPQSPRTRLIKAQNRE